MFGYQFGTVIALFYCYHSDWSTNLWYFTIYCLWLTEYTSL